MKNYEEYEEIVNASDRKILLALDAELEEINRNIGAARVSLETSKFAWEREIRAENLERWIGHYTGVSDARKIAYNAMQKKY